VQHVHAFPKALNLSGKLSQSNKQEAVHFCRCPHVSINKTVVFK